MPSPDSAFCSCRRCSERRRTSTAVARRSARHENGGDMKDIEKIKDAALAAITLFSDPETPATTIRAQRAQTAT
ncbi:hypothetical protein GCM10022383_03600 [Microbacterium soli]|uniref:Uncharacterized protein n=1 Tax=Microbacterium soli TaxID=446075 RepID=A0ABP7MSW8_9MICO